MGRGEVNPAVAWSSSSGQILREEGEVGGCPCRGTQACAWLGSADWVAFSCLLPALIRRPRAPGAAAWWEETPVSLVSRRSPRTLGRQGFGPRRLRSDDAGTRVTHFPRIAHERLWLWCN